MGFLDKVRHTMLDLDIQGVEYKGFRIYRWLEKIDLEHMHNSIICYVQRDRYTEKTLDEHGRVLNVVHEPEKFEFTVGQEEYIEYFLGDVIRTRLRCEVEYYLKHKLDITEDDFIHPTTRKYICPCCGTEFITDKKGYTPKCENCGARMTEVK